MDAVRTPLATGTALELGNKLWRKEILKAGTIHYKGGKFEATPEYLDSVLAAYQDGAIGSVPFTFVDDTGAHVEAPERRRGNVVGLERTATGLDGIFALDDDADELVQKDRKFGVSVLIKHDRTTGGGKHYPAVLAHVAGTYDPVINNLGDWEEIAASNDAVDVLDLLALTSAPQDAPTKGSTMAEATTLTPEETAQLRSLLAKIDAAVPAGTTAEPETAPAVAEVVEAELTDEELQRLADGILSEDGAVEVIEPDLIAASNDSNDEVLALSQRVEAAEQARRDIELRLAQSEKREADTAFAAEKVELAQKHGIHPRITEMAKPLLHGTAGKVLALSNGNELDVADLMRKVMVEIATSPRLDLSQAKGSALDLDDDADEAKERAEMAALAVKSFS